MEAGSSKKRTKWNMCVYVKAFVKVLKTLTAHCVNASVDKKMNLWRQREELLHIQTNNDYYSHSQRGEAMTLPAGSDVSHTTYV